MEIKFRGSNLICEIRLKMLKKSKILRTVHSLLSWTAWNMAYCAVPISRSCIKRTEWKRSM